MIQWLKDRWYSWRDRRAVTRLARYYRRHPEAYEADKEFFRGGGAGYEE